MALMNVGQIVAWSQGRLQQGAPGQNIGGISTDSRTTGPGDCFIAIQGERFDGHEFVAQAIAQGATAIVVEKPFSNDKEPVPSNVAVIAVTDTTKALGHIARGYTEQFNIPIVAVTGSNGKTSTKDMIGTILRQVWPIVVTEKNYNNQIGLPHTLFRIDTRHRAAVVEMGMNSIGEIAYLADIARPKIGVVTNIGPVHLENLGTMERVADAKAELIEALPKDGIAVLNGDDERTRSLADRTEATVITFGFSNGAHARAGDVVVNGLEGTSFTLEFEGQTTPLCLQVPGRHQVQNAAAAAVVARKLGFSWDHIAKGLKSFMASDMRLHVRRLSQGITMINDAYNASPLSVAAGLDVVAQATAGRKVAILGDMLELGAVARKAHREIGEKAVESGASWLVTVGQFATEIAAGAAEAGLSEGNILRMDTAQEAAESVKEWIRPGDLVFIKGSRGVQLERVAAEIERHFPPVAEKEFDQS